MTLQSSHIQYDIHSPKQLIELNGYSSDKTENTEHISSLNPNDSNFDFQLWARAVKAQMLQTLQKRLGETEILEEGMD